MEEVKSNENKVTRTLLGELSNDLIIIGGIITSRFKSNDNIGLTRKTIVPKSIDNGFIRDEDLELINYKDLNRSNDSIIAKRITRLGDIVIKLSAPCNAVLIDENHIGLMVSSFCAIIRGVPTSFRNYLVAYLNSSMCQNNILSTCSSTTMSTLTTQKLKELPIICPNDNRQKEIADNYLNFVEKEKLLEKIYKLEKEKMEVILKRGIKNEQD